MTLDEARSAAYAEFLSAWGDETPVRLEYREADLREPGPNVAWVRVAFRNYGGGQLTLGPQDGRIYRRQAAVLIQVFTPVVSAGLGATLAQVARAIFEGRTVGGLQFNDGQVRESPLASSDKSYQTNVEVRVTYDETK